MPTPKNKKIEKFEDIFTWQKAKELVNRIYRISQEGGLARDHALKDQMRRAAISIPSNIAEGFERQSDDEFKKFLYYAKGSCGELRSQLYHAQDQKYISPEICKELQDICTHISSMISNFITYLKS